MNRRGFTLMEVMVSITILSIVSIGMVMTLSFAVRTFRAGEYSRAANDEAVTILATLEADLDRMLPAPMPVIDSLGTLSRPNTGGWIYAKILTYPGTVSGGSGSCLLAFTTRNPDRTQVSNTGENANMVVAWWVDTNGVLQRIEKPLRGTEADNMAVFDWIRAFASTGPTSPEPAGLNAIKTQVASGCMHFAAWVATQEIQAYARPMAGGTPTSTTTAGATAGPDWEQPNGTAGTDLRVSKLPPRRINDDVDSVRPGPYPSAVRVSLILAGPSRFKPQGTLRDDIKGIDLSPFRIVGLNPMPIPGTMLWIANTAGDPTTGPNYGDGEWIQVEATAGSKITDYKRFQLRSGPKDLAAGLEHPAGATVALGRPWSLVRIIPK